MHLRIHGDRCIHLLSSFAFQHALAAGEMEASPEYRADDWSAHSFFRQHFHDSYEIGALRWALAHDIHNVSNMSDDDVIAAAAQRLRSGAWCIGCDRLPPVAAVEAGPVGASAAGIGAALRHAAAPRPLRESAVRGPRPQRAPAHAASPAPATPAEPEWPEQTDQAAFAGGLEGAARDGTPFCEICAAMRNQPARIAG